MTAITHSWQGFLKKEHLLLSRQQRSHPYFILHLSLDALLSATIILIGFQVVASHASIDLHTAMGHSGAIAMTSSELIEHVKEDGRSVYWIGPATGYKYTINHPQDDGDMITYLSKASSLSNASQGKVAIETYKNLAAYAMDVHSFIGSNDAKLVTVDGITVKYNEATMDYEIVTFKGKPEIVIVSYPTSQLAITLMKNAANLKLIG